MAKTAPTANVEGTVIGDIAFRRHPDRTAGDGSHAPAVSPPKPKPNGVYAPS